jgi:hypothetical protein
MFLDRPEVFRRIARSRRILLARIGRYGQTVMQRLQRRVGLDGPYSQPGEPPNARVGTIRNLSTFAPADGGATTVVGVLPIVRSRTSVLHGKRGVPHLLNEGGRETFLATPNRSQPTTVTYEARPFTDPTMRRLWPWAKSLIRREAMG